MGQLNGEPMNDSTGMSSDMAVSLFRTELDCDDSMTPEKYFQSRPESRVYVLPIVIADIKNRVQKQLPFRVGDYIESFPELADHDEMWRLVEAAKSAGSEHFVHAKWSEEKKCAQLAGEQVSFSQRELKGGRREASCESIRPEPGERLLDFEVIRLAGRGTYGAVYLASNLKLGRNVALKITSETGVEGRALARLDHPNVVKVFGQYESGGRRILEMEFVDGGTLADWIAAGTSAGRDGANRAASDYRSWASRAEQGTGDSFSVQAAGDESSQGLPVSIRGAAQVAAWVTLQLARGLQHAHQRGILHQDVKPANILVNSKGVPLLTDFNVALVEGQSLKREVGGTVNYMSPEQLQAYCSGDLELAHALDVRSDVYSLGIVLLELLGGNKLWGLTELPTEVRLSERLLGVRLKPLPDSELKLPGLDRTLGAIVRKALQANVGERYQSASELEKDLTSWLAGKPNTFAENPSPVERAVRFAKRKKFTVLGSAAAFVAVVLITLGSLVWESNQLRECEALCTQVESLVAAGEGAKGAECLGAAKAKMTQLWISSFVNKNQLSQAQTSLERCTELLQRFDQLSFASLFGQASLLSIHQEQFSDQHEVGELVEESLKRYKVMSTSDWQLESPFIDLLPHRKQEVAEYITELMLVAMIHSSRSATPSEQQWETVLERLPEPHRELALFECLRNGKEPSAFRTQAVGALDSFERYLNGVWATSLGRDQQAEAWYSSSLLAQRPESRERFWLRYRMGLSAQRLAKYDEALEHYHVCLGMKPDFAWIPFNIALVQVRLGDHQAAKKSLQRAIYLDPHLTAGFLALASLQNESGEHVEALSTCERAMNAGNKSDLLEKQKEIAKASLALETRK